MAKRLSLILKQPQFQFAGIGGWQIVYTGFILILLCFFIMLTSFASLERSKITRFAKSFAHAVSVFNGGVSLEPGETLIRTKALVVSKEDQIAALFEIVKNLAQRNGLDQIAIRSTKRGVIMTLADVMLFNSGEAEISPSSYALLDKISALINKMDTPVDIEGHTDNLPIQTENYASNWELSTARAVSVLRYLMVEGKVDPHRLSAVGLSKYHPVASNSSSENRARNRRVEIIFRPELS